MKLGLLFGSVVFLIAGITFAGHSLEVTAQSMGPSTSLLNLTSSNVTANVMEKAKNVLSNLPNAIEGGLKKYENKSLGISFQYPSNWTEREFSLLCPRCIDFFITVPKSNTTINAATKAVMDTVPGECGSNESKLSISDFGDAILKCDVFSMHVSVVDLDNPNPSILGFLEEPCNCNTLKDFVAWVYKRAYVDTEYTEHTFINDNQTTIGSNHSAWQMESVDEGLKGNEFSSKTKEFTVWAINDNLGYTFQYSFPADSRFDRYLEGFKNMLKSVTFTTPIPEKKPSFLNSNDTADTSILPSTPTVQDKSFKILSSNDFIDSIGYLHVVGEVQNNTPTNAQFVKVTGTFYDTNNQVVATDFTYTNPSDIGSGQKAPFELTLTSASIPVSQIDHYELVASYQ